MQIGPLHVVLTSGENNSENAKKTKAEWMEEEEEATGRASEKTIFLLRYFLFPEKLKRGKEGRIYSPLL